MLLLLLFTYYRNNLSQFPFSALTWLGGGDDLTADIPVTASPGPSGKKRPLK